MKRRHLIQALGAAALTSVPAPAQVGTTIEDMEVFQIKVNQRGNWIIVRLKSNHGLYGIGDASHGGDTEVLALLKEYFDRLRGNSPFQIEPLRELLRPASAGRAGAVAFSALEQAMHDIQARALGVPAFALFGGMLHDRLRHYANINRATTNRTPEGFVEQASLAVKAGFVAIKMAPFDGMPRNDPKKAEAHTELGIECIAAVRKAIGPEIHLFVDAHSNFDVASGIELARRLEPFDLGWLEEVTRTVEGLAEINAAAKMSTAGGESIYGVRGFFPYIAAKAVDIVMPDIKYCGGMLELKKIAAMAEGAGLLCSPHGPASPVGNIAAAHVCATMSNFLILELGFNEVPWRGELLNPPEVFQPGGFMAVPEALGFGVRLNEPVARRWAV